jgi:protein required for attachment to host cells
LVADRGGARLLTGRGRRLRLLDAFAHPQGRLRNRDIDSDRPGRSFDSVGSARHANDTEDRATDHLAEIFAAQLSEILERGRVAHRFGRLVLVADRRFLGKLRQALTVQTLRLVGGSLAKDLSSLSDRDLVPIVSQWVGREVTAPSSY